VGGSDLRYSKALMSWRGRRGGVNTGAVGGVGFLQCRQTGKNQEQGNGYKVIRTHRPQMAPLPVNTQQLVVGFASAA